METTEGKNDLRAKLAEKIQTFRSQRKATEKVDRALLLQRRKEKAKARAEAKKLVKKESKAKQESKVAAYDTGNSSDNIADEENDNHKSTITYGTLIVGDDKFSNGKLKVAGKKRGPTDVFGALKHLEAKKRRIESMDEEKRRKIEESDKWHRVLLQAEGKKLKDNEQLLKKSIRRKEKEKKKSSDAWKERKDNEKKAMLMRQQRREENLKKRRESKKSKKGKAPKKKKPSKKK
ncbi:Ribosomal RNA-processing protein 14-C [Schizosaccharomyces pombe]